MQPGIHEPSDHSKNWHASQSKSDHRFVVPAKNGSADEASSRQQQPASQSTIRIGGLTTLHFVPMHLFSLSHFKNNPRAARRGAFEFPKMPWMR